MNFQRFSFKNVYRLLSDKTIDMNERHLVFKFYFNHIYINKQCVLSKIIFRPTWVAEWAILFQLEHRKVSNIGFKISLSIVQISFLT